MAEGNTMQQQLLAREHDTFEVRPMAHGRARLLLCSAP
jgi:hypothetical protein